MSSLTKLIQEFEELRQKFMTDGQAMLKEEFKEFFEKNPGITGFTWTQYSPYFNDGDECVFNVHSVTFSNAPDFENVSTYGEYEGEAEGVWLHGDEVYSDYDASPTPAEIAAMNELDRVIQSRAAEPILEALFGNHVKITVTKDGIEVNDYDHD